MRRFSFLYAILVFSLLIAFTGCVSEPPAAMESIDAGGSDYHSPDRIYLEDAFDALRADDGMRMARSPGYTIHNIIGTNVSAGGRAAIWIIAVKNEKPFYFVCTPTGFTTMEWREDHPDNAINMDNVLSPDALLGLNAHLIEDIFSTKEGRIHELELRNGKYYIRGYSDGIPWEYVFDAVDGRRLN